MQCNIKITNANVEKIQATLDAINGKARAFTIDSASTVLTYAQSAEKKLANSQLPEALRPGASAVIRPAGPAAKAYNYSAETTIIEIRRGSTDWFLTYVTRATVSPKSPEKFLIKITPAQHDEIARRAVADYDVMTMPDEAAR